jgi:hypothetical protein
MNDPPSFKSTAGFYLKGVGPHTIGQPANRKRLSVYPYRQAFLHVYEGRRAVFRTVVPQRPRPLIEAHGAETLKTI